MKTLTLSQALINQAAALLYRDWSEKFDILKAVKKEKDDGSKDWALFHTARLTNATNAHNDAKALLDEISTHHTIGRS